MSHWRSKSSNKKPDNKPISTPPPTSRQTRKFLCFGSSIPDKEHSPQISDAMRELEEIFQSLDIDADGYVSIADLKSVLKNFSHLCNSNEIMIRIFEELDLDHDHRISKQEFQFYKNLLLDREKHRSIFDDKFNSIFTLFDRNHDNYISPHEVRETMRNLGEQIDDHLLNEMMQTADIDHDGRISREEFEKLLRQLHQK